MSWRAGLLLVLLPSMAGAAASEAEALAAERFREGTAAYERGAARAAAAAFEEAYRLAPRGATLYNAGLAWEAAGERARAADAYELALELVGEGGKYAPDAQHRLAAMRRLLGVLVVTGPPDTFATVAHRRDVLLPARIHLLPGTHRVTVVTPDGPLSERTIQVRAGEQTMLALPARAASPAVVFTPSPAPRGSSARATLGWVALGTAGAAAGTAIVLGVTALNARQAYERSEFTDAVARERAATLRTWTNVTWVVAGVFAATGLTLELVKDAPGGAQATLTPAGSGVLVQGRY